MNDLSDVIVQNIRDQQARGPEGVSFYVVGTDSADIAREIGPMLAERLQPERRWGRVLHVGAMEVSADGWEVVVEDRGAYGA